MTYKEPNGCNACLANLLLIRHILTTKSMSNSKRCKKTFQVINSHIKMHDISPILFEMEIAETIAEIKRTRTLSNGKYYVDPMEFVRCNKCDVLYEHDQTNHKNYCMVGKQEELIRRGLR